MSTTMEASYYSDKAIAVFGNTQPWASNLRELGGSFNRRLQGKPGWIFPKTKEPQLMQFIAQANAGQIQPTPYTGPKSSYQAAQQQAIPYGVTQQQVVPYGATQPAMTPEEARMRLQIAQPTLQGSFPQVAVPVQPTLQGSFPQVAVPVQSTFQGSFPQVAVPVQQAQLVPLPQITIPLPKIEPIINIARPASPLTPKPVTVLPQRSTTVSYPNSFTAADNLQYQIVMYTVPLPSVGQRLTLNAGENQMEYTVSSIESVNPPIDSILITPVQVEENEEPQVSRGILVKGQWKISGLEDEHTVTFHPMA
jgi:hypothetical protein